MVDLLYVMSSHHDCYDLWNVSLLNTHTSLLWSIIINFKHFIHHHVAFDNQITYTRYQINPLHNHSVGLPQYPQR